MNPLENKGTLKLIFLNEKKDGNINAFHCENGSPQTEYMNHEDVSSPTVST
jgi:hypothetical protein